MKKFISAILLTALCLSLSVFSFAEGGLNWVIEPKHAFEDVEFFEKNVYVYTENGKKGLIDIDGKILIPAQYAAFERCTCGNIYTDSRKINVITLNPDYTVKTTEKEKFHTVCFGFYAMLNGSVQHISVGEKAIARPLENNGKAVTFEKISMMVDNISGGYLYETLRRKGVFGYVTASGTEVFDGSLSGAVGFLGGIGAVKKGDKWAYINADGKYLTEFLYSETKVPNHLTDTSKLYLVSEGLIPVCRDGRFGYINKDGREVVDCIYEKTTPVADGRAWIKKDGLWGVADLRNIPVPVDNVVISGFLNDSGHYVGESARLVFELEPPSSDVVWSSTDEKILTVAKDGTVFFKAPGDAVVNCSNTSGKLMASYPVTVTEKTETGDGNRGLMSKEVKNLTAFIFTAVFLCLALGCLAVIVILKVKKNKAVEGKTPERTEEKE